MQTSSAFASYRLLACLFSGCVALTGLTGISAVGCGGVVDGQPSSDPSPTDPGNPTTGNPATGTTGTTPTSDASPPIFTASELATPEATCGIPDSAVTPYASASELKSLLEGSWIYCPSGASDTLPYGAAGVQFTAEDEFRWLVIDSSGALTSGVSPLDSNVTSLTPATAVPAGDDADGAKITYDFEPFTSDPVNNVSGQINVWYADRSVMPTRATFESSPRRMALEDFDGTFVHVGP